MQVFRFVTMDDKKVTCWCETNMLKVFRDFMQYILDSCNSPEDFLLWDVKNDKIYNAYQIATEVYAMQKRSFNERMNNIQTGIYYNQLEGISEGYSLVPFIVGINAK